MRRRNRPYLTWGVILPTLLVFALIPTARAEYPDRPVKLIVPWAAGGDTDSILRIFANMAEKHLGQPVVVANIKGASGTVGAREARNATPDGYTVYSPHDSLHTTYYTGVAEINYWDFEPICLISSTYSIVTTHGKSPWKSFQEVLSAAKKDSNAVTFGATLGSTSHFFPAMIENALKTKLWKYVSYEGTAPRMTALMGGHIDMAESNLTQREKAKAGALRFLAIATEKRHPEIPDVPTLKELGIDVTYAVNRGLAAPKGTPEGALKKWEEICKKVTDDPAFHAAMKKQGTDVAFLDRNGYANFLKEQDDLNKTVAANLGYAQKK